MRDIVILAVTAAFFALCVAYVRWCDHIIGPDPDINADPAAAGEDRSVMVDDETETVPA